MTAVSAPATHVLRLEGITKRFGGVPALHDVGIALTAGAVHAVIGENGAGKSTLVKIMSGVHQPDEGTILFDGAPVTLRDPAGAFALGIHLVHQELALLPQSTVTENVFLGHERRGRAGLLDWETMRAETAAALGRLGCSLDPGLRVERLTVADRQMVEIARALVADVRVLILDEPTAALSPEEASRLFTVIESLKAAGTAVVYISHRLDEVIAVADEVTVLKDGRHVATLPVGATSPADLVRLMVGRPIEDLYPPRGAAPGRPLVSVANLSLPPHLLDVGFELHAGQIVGIAGLQGQGQDELLRCLAGDLRPVRGEITIAGARAGRGGVRGMMHRGLGLVPEDRKRDGLVLEFSGVRNVVLPALDAFTRRGLVDRAASETYGRAGGAKVGVRGDLALPVSALSGGNQQKVVLAKWLAAGVSVLLLNQPTRGVDVGAKSEIYHLLRAFADAGNAVLVSSPELPEVLGLSDRILVMRAGRIVADLPAGSSEETVMAAAVGA